MNTNTSEDRLADLRQREEPALGAELAALRQRLGTELALSRWRLVTQDNADAFAELTGDRQWIHTDPSPGGATLILLLTFESARGGKPVCVAQAVYRVFEEDR